MAKVGIKRLRASICHEFTGFNHCRTFEVYLNFLNIFQIFPGNLEKIPCSIILDFTSSRPFKNLATSFVVCCQSMVSTLCLSSAKIHDLLVTTHPLSLRFVPF